MNLDYTVIPTIIVICYLIAEAVKRTPIDNKWIPTIVGGIGGILGIVGMFTMPDFPAPDVLSAIAIGISSGLASTGINQIYKQLKNGSNDNDE